MPLLPRRSRATALLATAACLAPMRGAEAASTTTAGDFQPSALQTGPDALGGSFAADAQWNPADRSLWVVGSTFGEAFSPNSRLASAPDGDFQGGCFFASLDPATEAGLAWRQRQTLATPGVQQACTNMLLLPAARRAVATGYAQEGNLLGDQYEAGGYADVAQFGMVLDLAVDDDGGGSGRPAVRLRGGHLMQDSTVTYPVDIHAQAGDGFAYVLSMETNEDVQRQDRITDLRQDPARFFQYGSSQYTMVVTQVALSVSESSTDDGAMQVLEERWRHSFATNTGASVHASGVLKVSDDVLIAVGTTSGHGEAFGKDALPGNDLDGFITKLNPSTGKIVGSWTDPTNLASVRLQSMNQRDDWVSGVCHNPRDSNNIYVVGATKGRLNPDAPESYHPESVQAFVMKVNVYSLTPSWIRQLAVPDSDRQATAVRAASCTVTPDGGSVYFGGIVENDGVLPLSGTEESYGGDDVFVAKVEASTGALKFVRQFGSDKDDEIAVRGGLASDASGNAIVVGNTFGSMYRARGEDESHSDVFVATIGAFNGKIVLPIHSSSDSSGAGLIGGDIAEPKFAGILLIVFGAVLVGTFLCCIVKRRRDREVSTDRQHVLTYLGDFDVEDVDLKHSATGGWHCSYAGPLAHGINNKSRFRSSFSRFIERDEDMTSPLTDAVTYTDSLFLTESETPRLRNAGYTDDDDLADGYGQSVTENLSRKRGNPRGGWGRDII